jgi:hypothetical protein
LDGALRLSIGDNMNARRAKLLARFTVAALVALTTTPPLPAVGHDVWANGEKVPPWVKKACCGPSEAHRLPKGNVRALPDGYHVDGLDAVIPYSRALPSHDGEFWGFWNPDATHPVVFCFFAPPSLL